MAEFVTSFGVFNLVENGNGGTILNMSGKKIAEYPQVPMWNLDEIARRLNEDKETITQRIKERVTADEPKEQTTEEKIALVKELMADKDVWQHFRQIYHDSLQYLPKKYNPILLATDIAEKVSGITY